MKRICAIGALILISVPAIATDYQLTHLDLGSGFSLDGTVSTDGTVGALSAANITTWDVTVTQVTDLLYTKANTANLSSLVQSDGHYLLVPTSPDGISDGGSIWFRGGNYLQTQVADFTGSNTAGGQAYYVHGGAFGMLPLNQANGSTYLAATARPGSSTQFDLTPLDFGSGVTMFGSITTDGSTGPAHFLDWRVVVRESTHWRFTPSNSAVLYDMNIWSEGSHLLVSPLDGNGNYGEFAIGRYVGFDMYGVLLADYSYIPDGQAGLITPAFMQTVSPLALDGNGNYIVATAVPEPTGLVILSSALAILLGRRRSR